MSIATVSKIDFSNHFLQRRTRRQWAPLTILATLLFLFSSPPWSTARAQDGREFNCSGSHKIKQWRDKSGRSWASWSQTILLKSGEAISAHCGFTDGHRFPLTDMGVYPAPLMYKMQKLAVWVYEGMGDTCSQGKLLILNEAVPSVVILTVYDSSSEVYKCSPK